MHFNIWINDELMKEVEAIMKVEKKKRNKVINEAVVEYVNKVKRREWPDEIKNFKGIEGLEDWEGFEADRYKFKEESKGIFGEKG